MSPLVALCVFDGRGTSACLFKGYKGLALMRWLISRRGDRDENKEK